MTVFALVENGIVVGLNVSDQEYINSLPNASQWYETDPHTRGGIHYGEDDLPDGGVPFRGNYAYIGGTYDAVNNVFYSPQPFPSWTISAPTWTWVPPVPYPNDENVYNWDEQQQKWVQV
jgi:hypothetical protein